MTYMVTSKPKRISVAAGVAHMIVSFLMYSQQYVVFVCFTSWATALKVHYAHHVKLPNDLT